MNRKHQPWHASRNKKEAVTDSVKLVLLIWVLVGAIVVGVFAAPVVAYLFDVETGNWKPPAINTASNQGAVDGTAH